MNYILNNEQLYNAMKPFFNLRFKDTYLDTKIYSGQLWFGVWNKNGDLLVGKRNDSELNDYYFNGEIFSDDWKIFSITPNIFSKMMAKYLEEKHEMEINFLS